VDKGRLLRPPGWDFPKSHGPVSRATSKCPSVRTERETENSISMKPETNDRLKLLIGLGGRQNRPLRNKSTQESSSRSWTDAHEHSFESRQRLGTNLGVLRMKASGVPPLEREVLQSDTGSGQHHRSYDDDSARDPTGLRSHGRPPIDLSPTAPSAPIASGKLALRAIVKHYRPRERYLHPLVAVRAP
jgi:hypothetical protein